MPPAREQIFLATPTLTAAARIIASPFQFLVTGDDNLRLESWNTAAGVVVSVHFRFASLAGGVTAHAISHVANTDRTRRETDHALGEGYLLNAVALVTAGTPLPGQTFVCVKLIRGLTGATIVLGILVQGYITNEQVLGWPGSPISNSLESPGVARVFTGTDPAAGVEITETVPTGARWELLSVGAQLVAAAGGADRRPILFLGPTAANLLASWQPTTQAGGATADWFWGSGMMLETAPSGNARVAGLPPGFLLLPGDRLRTSSDNFAAGDNWGAPTYSVREWLEAS